MDKGQRRYPEGKAGGPKMGKREELGERKGECRNSFFPGSGNLQRLPLASSLEASTGQMGVLDTVPWICVPQSLSACIPRPLHCS